MTSLQHNLVCLPFGRLSSIIPDTIPHILSLSRFVVVICSVFSKSRLPIPGNYSHLLGERNYQQLIWLKAILCLNVPRSFSPHIVPFLLTMTKKSPLRAYKIFRSSIKLSLGPHCIFYTTRIVCFPRDNSTFIIAKYNILENITLRVI